MVCNECQATMNEGTNMGARFCTSCGRPLEQAYNGARGPLVRVRQGKIIAGVCGGFAKRYNIDPVLLRLATVLVVLAGLGSAVVAYFVLWIVMPKEPMWAITDMPSAMPPAMPPTMGATA